MEENRFSMNSGGDENPDNFTKQSGEEPQEIPYEDRLKIAWYIVSRSMLVNLVLGMITGMAIGLLAGITGAGLDGESASLVGMIAGLAVSILIGFPIVVGWMLKKQFNGFKIRIERDKPED